MGILLESCLFALLWFFVDVVLFGIGRGLLWLGRTVWSLFAGLYHEIRGWVRRLIGRRNPHGGQQSNLEI